MFTTTLSAIALILAPTPAASQDDAEAKGIVQLVAESPNFQTLYSCIQAAEMDEAFDEGGPFTVFAPTDEAFAKLPKETVEGLLEDKEALARILKYHVVPAEVSGADAKQAAGTEVTTLLEGCPLPVSADGEDVMVGGARVIKPDVPASNGVVHVIDAVLMPPDS
jgi:uncharacterized surface protein with fasciclin (FAS1) repeats